MYNIKVNPKNTLENLTHSFDYKYITSQFKLPKGKKETLEVELVNFDKYFNNNQEVKEAMGEKGLELVTIRQALELANTYPELQKEKWFATVEGDYFELFSKHP